MISVASSFQWHFGSGSGISLSPLGAHRCTSQHVPCGRKEGTSLWFGQTWWCTCFMAPGRKGWMGHAQPWDPILFPGNLVTLLWSQVLSQQWDICSSIATNDIIWSPYHFSEAESLLTLWHEKREFLCTWGLVKSSYPSCVLCNESGFPPVSILHYSDGPLLIPFEWVLQRFVFHLLSVSKLKGIWE